jgi:hypothetical protein
VREIKPKKVQARGENPTRVIYDELGHFSSGEIESPATGRVSSDQQQETVPDAAMDTIAEAEVHDGSIQADSMSLCGLSTDPLPPLQAT